MALLAKSGSQMGNTRSFVFGCENSNSGVVAADSQPQVCAPSNYPVYIAPHILQWLGARISFFQAAAAGLPPNVSSTGPILAGLVAVQGSGSQVPLTAGPGPTSFAGIHLGTSAAGIRSGEADKPSNLLGMLHTKMRSKAGTAQPEKDAAAVQMRSIMTGKKTKHTLARKF